MEQGSLQRETHKRAGAAKARSPEGELRADAPARVRGINRAVEIFKLLHSVRKPISIGEIAKCLKAPRSTIYEIVNLFLEAEILEYVGGGSDVYFGRAMHLYANDYFATHALPREGLEEVRRLAALTGETCQLCMPIGNKYAVVAMQNSSRLFRIGSDLGVLVPIPWTASGRLFVAHLTLAELTSFIPSEDFRMPDGRVIDPKRFLAEAKAAFQSGICVIGGLVDDYATCIAAPIVSETRRECIASICFIVASRSGGTRKRELIRLLMDSARKLSYLDEGARRQ